MKELKMYERYGSMSEFLKTDTNWRSPDYLARELYEINTYKLKDKELLACDELRDYYISRQGTIITRLRNLLDKDLKE
jgi:hypothetical protein